MQGFIVLDHWSRYPRFLEEVGPRVANGEIDYDETIEDGLEHTSDAFLPLTRWLMTSAIQHRQGRSDIVPAGVATAEASSPPTGSPGWP